jgi:DNA-directed RNA polymerase specialized sigma24 family protein
MIGDHDQLERGLKRLKPDQRSAVVLHFYLGLTVPEVADAQDVPVGTAKSRIHYAIDALRAAIEADERAPIRATSGVTR